MNAMKPLSGLRVLDFSWVWSGPLVAAMLGEFGAEVIKIEHGRRLDNSRLRGRPTKDGAVVDGPSIELNPYFHQTNHGKISITVNLKETEGVELLLRLAEETDIVIENLTPGALARSGLGYESLSARNPEIIMLSMSAAGQTGPLSGMRAYAPIMSSYCGLETLVGYSGEPPTGMMNFGYGDPNAAIHGLIPLLAALLERDRTGRGCHIDMSQIEALMSVLVEPIMEWTVGNTMPVASGNHHRLHVPYGIYPTMQKDRWIAIAVTQDEEWDALCECMGRPDWVTPEFSTAEGRRLQREFIDERLAHWTRTRPCNDLIEALQSKGIAASGVQGIEEQAVDPQFAARGTRVACDHPYYGAEELYRAPWNMSGTPPAIDSSAPVLGSGNQRIFGELLGLTATEIEDLTKRGVLA